MKRLYLYVGSFTGCLLIFLLYVNCVFADFNQVLFINIEDEAYKTGQYTLDNSLYILADKTGNWTIEDVSGIDFASKFILNDTDTIKTSPDIAAYWIRLTIKNNLPTTEQWFLRSNPNYFVDLYIPLPSDEFELRQSGIFLPYSARYSTKTFRAIPLLPLFINTQQEQTIYWQITFNSNQNSNNSIRAMLYSQAFIENYDRIYRYGQGVFIGIFFSMAFYHLILFFFVRDKAYFLFGLYGFFFGSAWMVIGGYGIELLWPNYPHWNEISPLILVPIALIFFIQFSQTYLYTKKYTPKLHLLLNGIIALFGLIVVLTPLEFNFLFSLFFIAVLLTSVIPIIASVFIWQKGYQPAAVYLGANFMALGGAFVFALLNLGFVTDSFFVRYSLQIGAALEMILFALGLAQRINILRLEKNQAQAEVLQKQQEALRLKDELHVALQISHNELEIRVKERTSDLSQANKRLQQLNNRLQDELTLARKIQQNLLPPSKPKWADMDVVCYSTPAYEVGGDLYVYHAFGQNDPSKQLYKSEEISQYISPSSFVVAVGDVSGKGMAAALMMGISLASFQFVITQRLAPNKLLAYLNRAIFPYTYATGQNCALVYAEITLPTHNKKEITLKVANAGCIIPLIRHENGTVNWVDAIGLPLGIELSNDFKYQTKEVVLTKGDLIILSSDGVIEANNITNEIFGFDRLEQAVITGPTTSVQAMLDHIKTQILAFVGDAEPHDDLTIVVVKV